jgi:hypothetical protein
MHLHHLKEKTYRKIVAKCKDDEIFLFAKRIFFSNDADALTDSKYVTLFILCERQSIKIIIFFNFRRDTTSCLGHKMKLDLKGCIAKDQSKQPLKLLNNLIMFHFQ